MRTPGRTRRVRTAVSMGAVTAVMMVAAPSASAAVAQHDDPAAKVAALDTRYQAAVKANDAATMGRILAADFVLVTGSGHTYTRDDLIDAARTKDCVYQQQEEVAGTQTVRVFGSRTAVVTAQLWEKGTCKDGSTFDDHLWFSDTYVRRHGNWTYVFGQASRPL
jgi:ketosteroid isomerase-like protein